MTNANAVDVAIIIALGEEFNELHSKIEEICTSVRNPSTGSYDYLFEYQRSEQSPRYKCMATFAGDMGPTKAGIVTQRVQSRYDPMTIVMLGIAAGISDDVRVGDVVIGTQVDGYMENSKSDGGDQFAINPSGEVYRATMNFVNFARNLRYAHADAYRLWVKSCDVELNSLIPSEILRALLDKDMLRTQASMIAGHIASGPTVGASQGFIAWLKRRDRKYLALEMESVGLMAAVHEEAAPRKTLVLRGVSDYGDERKSELDRTSGGALRKYAIRNAINLLWCFMDADELPRQQSIAETNFSVDKDVADQIGLKNTSSNQPSTQLLNAEIEELTNVISSEGNPLTFDYSQGLGGVVVNPARMLSTRFLTLPIHKRIGLAINLGLIQDSEKQLQSDEMSRLIFSRAKHTQTLNLLWDAVEHAHGSDTSSKKQSGNPFLKII